MAQFALSNRQLLGLVGLVFLSCCITMTRADGGACSKDSDCFTSSCITNECVCDIGYRGAFCALLEGCPVGWEIDEDSSASYLNGSTLTSGCSLCGPGSYTDVRRVDGGIALSEYPNFNELSEFDDLDPGVLATIPVDLAATDDCIPCGVPTAGGSAGCLEYNTEAFETLSLGTAVLVYVGMAVLLSIGVWRACKRDVGTNKTSLLLLVGGTIMFFYASSTWNAYQNATDPDPALMKLWALSENITEVSSLGQPVCILDLDEYQRLIVLNSFPSVNGTRLNDDNYLRMEGFGESKAMLWSKDLSSPPTEIMEWSLSGVVDACAVSRNNAGEPAGLWFMTRPSTDSIDSSIAVVNATTFVHEATRPLDAPLVVDKYSWVMAQTRLPGAVRTQPTTVHSQLAHVADHLIWGVSGRGINGRDEAVNSTRYGEMILRPTTFVFDVQSYNTFVGLDGSPIGPIAGGVFSSSSTPAKMLPSGLFFTPRDHYDLGSFDPNNIPDYPFNAIVTNGMNPTLGGFEKGHLYIQDTSEDANPSNLYIAYEYSQPWLDTIEALNSRALESSSNSYLDFWQSDTEHPCYPEKNDYRLAEDLRVCWPHLRRWNVETNSSTEFVFGPIAEQDLDDAKTNSKASLLKKVMSVHIHPSGSPALVTTLDGIAVYPWPTAVEVDDLDTWMDEDDVYVLRAIDVLKFQRMEGTQSTSGSEGGLPRRDYYAFMSNLPGTTYSTTAVDWNNGKALCLDTWLPESIVESQSGQSWVAWDRTYHFTSRIPAFPVAMEQLAWVADADKESTNLPGMLRLAPQMLGSDFNPNSEAVLPYNDRDIDPLYGHSMLQHIYPQSSDNEDDAFDANFNEALRAQCRVLGWDRGASSAPYTCFSPSFTHARQSLAATITVEPASYSSALVIVTSIVCVGLLVGVLIFGYWFSHPHLDDFAAVYSDKITDVFAFAHVKIYLSMVLEGLQISSFAFVGSIPWPEDSNVVFFFRTFPLASTNEIAKFLHDISASPAEIEAILVWVNFVASIISSVFILLFAIGAYNLVYRLGVGKAPFLGQWSAPLNLVVVPLFSSVMLLPVLRYLTDPIACSVDEETGLSLQSTSEQFGFRFLCYDSELAIRSGLDASIVPHFWTVSASMILLWIYYPLALRVSGVNQAIKKMRGSNQEIFFLPRFLFLVTTAKYVLALLGAVLANVGPRLYTGSSIGVTAFLVYKGIILKPSGIHWVNRLRVSILAAAGLSNVGALVTLFVNVPSSYLGIYVLYGAWALAFVFFGLLAPRSWYQGAPPEGAVDPAGHKITTGAGESRMNVMASTLQATATSRTVPPRQRRKQLAWQVFLIGLMGLSAFAGLDMVGQPDWKGKTWGDGQGVFHNVSNQDRDTKAELNSLLVLPSNIITGLALIMNYRVVFSTGNSAQTNTAGKIAIIGVVLKIVILSTVPISDSSSIPETAYIVLTVLMVGWSRLAPNTESVADRLKGE